jgi:hypothetical protein
MNLNTLESLIKESAYLSDEDIKPKDILSLIALLREMNVLIYDAIETGDDDPLREALAKYEEMTK